MSTRRRRRRSRRRNNSPWIISIIICLVLFIGIGTAVKYTHEHFRSNTFINNVDCSKLTVDKAFQKINESLNSNDITYLFVDESFTSCDFDYEITLDNTKELEKILEAQNDGNKTREFTLSRVSLNEEKMKEYLQTFRCFAEENIHKAQNAYLVLGEDNFFYIQPEITGNELDFVEACKFASATLKSGKTTVDFREITQIYPEIISTTPELIAQKDRLNEILSTKVNYLLPNGNIFTLDSNTIKYWLYQSEDGTYHMDLDSKLLPFIDELEKMVINSNSTVLFTATNLKDIELSVPRSFRGTLNREKEITQIKNELGKIVNRFPIYEKAAFSFKNHNSYVEIDTTRQNVWMYVDGNCIVDTPCVTGNYPNHHTPSGIFSLTSRERDRYLRGTNDDGSKYKSYVNYWMPFNGGIGLHDATWRNKFGGSIYKGNGSHGCVNLPLTAAATIYENITYEMPIVVYAS